MRTLKTVLALAVLLSVAACGERPQEPTEVKRSYQGKRDTLPWDNGPLTAEYRGGQWKKGDRASWEDSIKQRQLAQHEHRRIYQ
jgi:predicted small lipoprotein YifL